MVVTQKNETKVSVIIPTYNSKKFLCAAIDSVLSQSYDNYEIVVVDDGSTDNTQQLMNEYIGNNKIRYIRQRNRGVSAARNLGATKSDGIYLCFLDSDDLFLKDNLRQKAKILDEDADICLVHADVQMISEEGNVLNEFNRGLSGYGLYKELLLWQRCVVPAPSSVMIRRDVFNKAGGWDENLSTAADQDLFIRISVMGKIERIPTVLTYYRIVAGSMSKKAIVFEKDHLMVYRKAKNAGLFDNTQLERNAFAQLYLLIAAYWWHYNKSFVKTLKYLSLAMLKNPRNLLTRIYGKKPLST